MKGPYSNYTNSAKIGPLKTGVGIIIPMPVMAAQVRFTVRGREVSREQAEAILRGKVSR